MVKHSQFRECARRSGIPTVCCCVGKGLKLEEDLIKPNPTDVGTLVKIIPGERHCHRAHVWRAQERHRQTERLRTWKKVWLGACRKCSGFNGQPVGETVGQLMNTDTSWITSVKRRGFTRFVLYFGRLLFVLQEKSAQKKPCSFSVSSLAAWGVRLGFAQICDCVGEASFCGRLQLNNRNKASSKTSKD